MMSKKSKQGVHRQVAQIHTILFTTPVTWANPACIARAPQGSLCAQEAGEGTRNLMMTTEDSVSLTGFVLEGSRGGLLLWWLGWKMFPIVLVTQTPGARLMVLLAKHRRCGLFTGSMSLGLGLDVSKTPAGLVSLLCTLDPRGKFSALPITIPAAMMDSNPLELLVPTNSFLCMMPWSEYFITAIEELRLLHILKGWRFEEGPSERIGI